jgi:hypothetical protein
MSGVDFSRNFVYLFHDVPMVRPCSDRLLKWLSPKFKGAALPLTLVSYCFVERGGPKPICVVRKPIDPGVAEYFEAHIVDLISRPSKKVVPPARFANPGARLRFEHLAGGTENEFVSAAQELATRLYEKMQPTTAKKGFFVALRRQGEGASEGVVLKLDASEGPAAALETTKNGPELEAIADLLDIPGALQKGAVSPDTRANSDVIVGERWDNTRQYFLAALDVVQNLSERESMYQLLRVVQLRAPASVPNVLRGIAEREHATDYTTLLSEPALLEEPILTNVLNELGRSPRPLLPMNRDHVPPIRKIEADGVVISAPVLEFDEKVNWGRRDPPELGWRITVDVLNEPVNKLT